MSGDRERLECCGDTNCTCESCSASKHYSNNVKQQAGLLSKLFAELEDKGTWFEFNYDAAWRKHHCECPDLRSDLSNWRVAEPEKKIINISMMIDSDIDMEFSNHMGQDWFVYKLTDINKNGYYSITNDKYGHSCRIRQNHWHSWNGGGNHPLPEGLTGKIRLRDRCVLPLSCATKWEYDACDESLDIIAFWIDGTVNNYKYEWEE